jgi:hypothetical protein
MKENRCESLDVVPRATILQISCERSNRKDNRYHGAKRDHKRNDIMEDEVLKNVFKHLNFSDALKYAYSLFIRFRELCASSASVSKQFLVCTSNRISHLAATHQLSSDEKVVCFRALLLFLPSNFEIVDKIQERNLTELRKQLWEKLWSGEIISIPQIVCFACLVPLFITLILSGVWFFHHLSE